ncbi:hypothetical protein IU450_37230 [Nocardia abscessus]|uniref:hypothetical protein n=1 Tax=Nocardia abscessus TaxID=120957 RepID=UPI001895558C|nr:hypothetical protein [Nocardia abscessus]MBF6341484.1 hypothetical protein [Nocardia abscessus]
MSDSTSNSGDQTCANFDESTSDSHVVDEVDFEKRTRERRYANRLRNSDVRYAFLIATGPLGFATMMLLDHRAVSAFEAECRAADHPGALSLGHPYGLWLPIGIAAALTVSAVVAVVLLVRALTRPSFQRRHTAAVLLPAALLVDAVCLLVTSNILVYYPGMDISTPYGLRCSML